MHGGRGWGRSSARTAARDRVPSSCAAPARRPRGRDRRTRCACRRARRATAVGTGPWRPSGMRALPWRAILCDSSSWRLLSNGCGDRRPTMDGERSRRSFFSPSVQQAPGHPRRERIGQRLPLPHDRHEGALAGVHERRLREQPGVDAVEEQARPHGEVDHRCLLRRHVAAQVAHEVGLPGGELLRQRGAPVEKAAPDGLDRAPERRESWGTTRARQAPKSLVAQAFFRRCWTPSPVAWRRFRRSRDLGPAERVRPRRHLARRWRRDDYNLPPGRRPTSPTCSAVAQEVSVAAAPGAEVLARRHPRRPGPVGPEGGSMFTLLSRSPSGGKRCLWLSAAAAAAALAAAAPAQAAPFAYVANASGSVSQYELGAGGLLSPLMPATVPAGDISVGVAVSPDGNSVYVANQESASVSQYDMGPDGTRTAKNPPTVAAGGGAQAVAVSPDGKSVH